VREGERTEREWRRIEIGPRENERESRERMKRTARE